VGKRLFKPDEIIIQACETAESDSFGAEGWKEGLEVLLGCLDNEVQLNGLGREMFRVLVTGALVARLRTVKWAREHPELLCAPVERPFIIVGMARAGTTLLSYLFDQDDRFRSLLAWEVGDAVPPPMPDELRAGPRVEAQRQVETLINDLNPGLRAIHHEDADGPTECHGLLAQHFMSIAWLFGAAPTYSRWLIESDHRSAYQHHLLTLQVLQAHTARRWSLKAIQHVIALDALTSVYADARLVILHRDPVATVASACSLFNNALQIFTQADCRPDVAASYLDFLEAGVVRSAAFMDDHPTWPIVEIRYDDFLRDPISTVRRIYEAFDEPFLSSVEQKMRKWLADHPQGEFGNHRYSLSALGLDRVEIEDRFGSYRQRYDLPRESVLD
jgi:hypothetical protein